MITTQTHIPPTTAHAGIVEAMADKMREMGENGIPVTAESLASHSDFTRAQIAKHGEAAADFAKSSRTRQTDKVDA